MLKSLMNPPQDVKEVFLCIIHILAGINPDIPVTKKGYLKNDSEDTWPIA